jgi:hypothetical protein
MRFFSTRNALGSDRLKGAVDLSLKAPQEDSVGRRNLSRERILRDPERVTDGRGPGPVFKHYFDQEAWRSPDRGSTTV